MTIYRFASLFFCFAGPIKNEHTTVDTRTKFQWRCHILSTALMEVSLLFVFSSLFCQTSKMEIIFISKYVTNKRLLFALTLSWELSTLFQFENSPYWAIALSLRTHTQNSHFTLKWTMKSTWIHGFFRIECAQRQANEKFDQQSAIFNQQSKYF